MWQAALLPLCTATTNRRHQHCRHRRGSGRDTCTGIKKQLHTRRQTAYLDDADTGHDFAEEVSVLDAVQQLEACRADSEEPDSEEPDNAQHMQQDNSSGTPGQQTQGATPA